MYTLHQIKGRPRELMSIRDASQVLDLVTYPDGSRGILRNGVSVGVWEAEEHENCIHALAVLAGFVGGDVPAETIGRSLRISYPRPDPCLN